MLTQVALQIALVAGAAADRPPDVTHHPDGSKRTSCRWVEVDGRWVRDGMYRRWSEDGMLLAVGKYRKGLRFGTWKFTWKFQPEDREFFEKGSYQLQRNGGSVESYRVGRWEASSERRSGMYSFREEKYEGEPAIGRGSTLHGERQGAWTFLWSNGRPMFRGWFERGAPIRDWHFFHPSGVHDPEFLSGHFAMRPSTRVTWFPMAVERTGPPVLVDEPTSDDFELLFDRGDGADLTLLEAIPVHGLLPETERWLRESLRVFLDEPRDRRVAATQALLHEGQRALPLVLSAWKDLDLGDPGEGAKAGRIHRELVGPILGVELAPWRSASSAADVEENRRTILRTFSIWRLFEHREGFWRGGLRAILDQRLSVRSRHRFLRMALVSARANKMTSIRGALIGGVSQSAAHERAVDDALRWLAAHQSPAGSWSAAGFAALCGGECDGEGVRMHDVGVTGLAVLAMQCGTERQRREYAENVERALGWLLEVQDRELGCFGVVNSHVGFLYDHAIATTALCQALNDAWTPERHLAAQPAVDFILAARNPYKAWRYSYPPDGNNDMSVTGWMVMALSTAEKSGILVDGVAFEGARLFVDEMTDRNTWRTGYLSKGGYSDREPGMNERWPETKTEAMTALAMVCRLLWGEEPKKSHAMAGGENLLRKQLPFWDEREGTIDYLYWMYGSYAMAAMSPPGQDRWWGNLSEMVKTQRQDGHARGSWDPQYDPWGHRGGRVYATAVMALAIEAPTGRLLGLDE